MDADRLLQSAAVSAAAGGSCGPGRVGGLGSVASRWRKRGCAADSAASCSIRKSACNHLGAHLAARLADCSFIRPFSKPAERAAGCLASDLLSHLFTLRQHFIF